MQLKLKKKAGSVIISIKKSDCQEKFTLDNNLHINNL